MTIILTHFFFSFFVPPGHEYPYAIQVYHNRHRLEYSDKPYQLQFIVKRKETIAIGKTKFSFSLKATSVFHTGIKIVPLCITKG